MNNKKPHAEPGAVEAARKKTMKEYRIFGVSQLHSRVFAFNKTEAWLKACDLPDEEWKAAESFPWKIHVTELQEVSRELAKAIEEIGRPQENAK